LGEQVRRRHPVCVHTRTEGRWLSRPGFESQRLHISSSRGRSSVAEQLNAIATLCSLARRTEG